MSQVAALFEKPLLELLFEAQQVHRQHFDPRQVQVSTLLSIKTGACPEDCKYCPQSARYKTGLDAERLMEVEQVLESARKAKNAGSTRFCMGAAWKNPNDRDMPYLEQMVEGVKAMGLEACMTLGTLTDNRRSVWRKPGWITTTTTWTPRRSFTAISSPPVPIRSAWIRSIKCVMRESRSVLAGL
jgi:biotin synthase